MVEMSFEYWNKLADQVVVISSLLGGFSIAVVANLLVSNTNTRIARNLLKGAVLAASLFLVSVFAETKVLMMTTGGFPFEITKGDLIVASVLGAVAFFLGIISLITIISLAGWTKSKKMGRFTSAVGIMTLVLVLYMIT